MRRVAPSMDISAVMPAFNEATNLKQAVGRTAEALAAQARSFEIIVVDDGSRDDTPAVLERLKVVHATRSIAAMVPPSDRDSTRPACPGSS